MQGHILISWKNKEIGYMALHICWTTMVHLKPASNKSMQQTLFWKLEHASGK